MKKIAMIELFLLIANIFNEMKFRIPYEKTLRKKLSVSHVYPNLGLVQN